MYKKQLHYNPHFTHRRQENPFLRRNQRVRASEAGPLPRQQILGRGLAGMGKRNMKLCACADVGITSQPSCHPSSAIVAAAAAAHPLGKGPGAQWM